MTQQIHDSAKPLKIFLIAGEASGDVIGGKLMQAMKSAADERGYAITFDGIGGEHMAAAGLKTRFPMRELSLIGIAEILPHLPQLLRRIKETVAAIRHEQPDMLITIDAPAFGLRVARRLGKSAKTLRVHYVAPQHWAWRPGRAKSLKHETDLLLALLPFEPAFFAQYGVTCHYVGHPAIEAFDQAQHMRGKDDGHNFRQKYHIANDAKIILLLPGSRHSECRSLMPQFTATLHQIAAEWPVNTPPPVVILPLTAASAEICQTQPHWQENLSKLPYRLVILPPDFDADKWDGFAAASVNGAALAASGTVTLELALAGVPTVLAYRLSWFSYLLVKIIGAGAACRIGKYHSRPRDHARIFAIALSPRFIGLCPQPIII